MPQVIDTNTATRLFIGLIAADISLFQFAHSRHHELSRECFALRDKIESLQEQKDSRPSPPGDDNDSQRNRTIRDHVDALRESYLIVLSRYYWATLGIKSVPIGFIFTIIVGLFLLFTDSAAWPPIAWVAAAMLPVAPVIFGAGAILFGDLWCAEIAQKIMHRRFIAMESNKSGSESVPSNPPSSANEEKPADQSCQLAWPLYCELRKELVEAQKIRTQVVGFKIAFVSAGIGAIIANAKEVPIGLMVIPAFAAVFFDLMISSYSFSIKRTGFFLRHVTEPILRAGNDWPPNLPLWEEFVSMKIAGVNLHFWAHLGLTIIAGVAGIVSLFAPAQVELSAAWRITLLVVLLALFALDVWAFLQPSKTFGTAGRPKPFPTSFAEFKALGRQ